MRLPPDWRVTWRTWAPLHIRFFIWLADLDRCWTTTRLERHGLPHHDECLLCDQAAETMQHLLIRCPFSRSIWHELLAWCQTPVDLPLTSSTLVEWWAVATTTVPSAMRKGLSSIILLAAWHIWKLRNSCVFDSAQPSCWELLQSIKDDARSWARAGKKGLAAIIPT